MTDGVFCKARQGYIRELSLSTAFLVSRQLWKKQIDHKSVNWFCMRRIFALKDWLKEIPFFQWKWHSLKSDYLREENIYVNIMWCGTDMTFAYLALVQKKVLLSDLRSFFIFCCWMSCSKNIRALTTVRNKRTHT